jgi:hypothetical protein
MELCGNEFTATVTELLVMLHPSLVMYEAVKVPELETTIEFPV